MTNIRTFSTNTQLVEKRRQQILRCARQLFVKKGYDRTTMRDIGRACRMTSAGIYHYVGKKEDIVRLVVQSEYAKVYAFIREAEDCLERMVPADALATAIERYYRMQADNRDHTNFVSGNYKYFKPALYLQVIETFDAVIAIFSKIISKCRAGDTESAGNSSLLAFNIVGMGQLWALRYEYLNARYTLDDFILFETNRAMAQLAVHTGSKNTVSKIKGRVRVS